MIAFDATLARGNFTLEAAFEAGEGITALFGPSGCGKSTIIRLIAGLERAGRARVQLGEALLSDTERGVFVPPHRRRLGLVFQDALLLPHLDVRANLLFGHALTPARERRVKLDGVVEVLGIAHLLTRRPDQLSGGERQRVAMGRAMLTSPHLLLLDEPLAALDSARKAEILPFIERLRDEFRIPMLYVSHAVEEVARLASTVVLLREGKVVTTGAVAETLDVAPGFGSAVSFLSATAAQPLPDYGVTRLSHPAGEITVPGLVDPAAALRVLIDARNVALARTPPVGTSVRTLLSGVIERVDLSGPLALVTLRLVGGEHLRASITRLAFDDLGLAAGMAAIAMVKTAAIDAEGVQGLRAPG